ncbi:hypothetical protein E2C01_032183 [Portunus trituberculatus]|uniref:Uncharacterized protein n=1 Tax=Portunus trituberculatus TaxID=210409 RepID=A0A5B7EWV0_PORTR|nr:hypothetical protein [Portunus trituberculatus]
MERGDEMWAITHKHTNTQSPSYTASLNACEWVEKGNNNGERSEQVEWGGLDLYNIEEGMREEEEKEKEKEKEKEEEEYKGIQRKAVFLLSRRFGNYF